MIIGISLGDKQLICSSWHQEEEKLYLDGWQEHTIKNYSHYQLTLFNITSLAECINSFLNNYAHKNKYIAFCIHSTMLEEQVYKQKPDISAILSDQTYASTYCEHMAPFYYAVNINQANILQYQLLISKTQAHLLAITTQTIALYYAYSQNTSNMLLPEQNSIELLRAFFKQAHYLYLEPYYISHNKEALITSLGLYYIGKALYETS